MSIQEVNTEIPDKSLFESYNIETKIGSGSFGEVFLVSDKQTNERLAAKIEESSKNNRLKDEYKIYTRMHRKGIQFGIPKVFSFIETQKFNIMIMELLGDNLDKIFNDHHKKISFGSIFLIGIEIIKILQQVHDIGYLHRDLKPNNIMFDFKNHNMLYLMDFGLAKRYIEKGKHISMKTDRSLVGTARYASINVHLGLEPSRRDDLESLGYILIYFYKGTLPWQGLKKESGVDHLQTIGNVKLSTSIEKICENVPKVFITYLKYCRNLKFDEKPDYDYLVNIFKKYTVDTKLNLSFDFKL